MSKSLIKNQFIKIIVTVLFAIPSSHSIAGVTGKAIAYSCYSCHGEKLNRLNLSATELTQTLIAFKTNKKSSSIMDRISKGFSDEELKAVAYYLSQQN
ncbi:MAG: hypothetical protein GQ532_06490 [Methylomarinum sp.]|nr:hypothetical protein [Methylomarinum sp.]